MTNAPTPPVVVGADGSARSLDAVAAAANEAALRGCPLRIVFAFVWPGVRIGTPAGVPKPAVSTLREQAETDLAEAVRVAREAAPGVQVSGEVVDGAAAPVLLEHSRDAALLVLGDRGLGAVSGAILGSVAVQAATYGRCPVLVVRGETRASGPVLVGVDAGESSATAVEFAAAEAARRGAELLAVHTWTSSRFTAPGVVATPADDQELIAEQERDVLAGLGERFPDVTVRAEVVQGPAANVLTELSQEAQLVVVGSRGRGGFAGLLLGSVSQHLIYRAGCPVAVVRPRAQ